MSHTALGIMTVIALSTLLGCTPSPTTQEKQEVTPTPAVAQPTKPVVAAKPALEAQKPGPAPVDGQATKVPDAIKDLQAKLEPAGASPPPPNEGKAARQIPQSKEPIPDAEKLLEAATKLANSLAGALEKGDLKESEALCVQEQELTKVLTPSYVPIIGGGIPAQNRSAIEHLISGLKGKKWTPELVQGRLSRAPEKGPFLGGLILLSGSVLRLKSEGVTLEAHLDEMVQVGSEWRVFRLSAP